MAMAEYAWTSFNGNAKVYDCYAAATKGDERWHPTQKPVELYAWQLKMFAKEGDKIFDPMMGSQSSRIAAYKLGFDYVGCELSNNYFKQGEERFRKQCLGEFKLANGEVVKQLKLFE